MRYQAMIATVGVAANCSFLTDGAVDLATCIRLGAEEMSRRNLATWQVDCAVRNKRTVTAILIPNAGVANDSTINALRQLHVPEDAIYYSGPDAPSVGYPVALGPVNVYDPYFKDNRKYSNSSALGSQVRVATLMARTGDHFVVLMRSRTDGMVEVMGLR